MKARLLLALALLVAPGLAPRAGAGALARLSIDHVRVHGGRHVLVLRAQDAEGHAVEGLEHDVSVRLDGHDVAQPQVHSPFAGRPRATVTVVIDGDLLRADSPSSDAVDALFRGLATGLGGEDRIRVLSAGGSVRTQEWKTGDLRDGATQARGLAQPDTPRLLDAIDDGLRDAADRNASSAPVLLVVTHGRDRDSKRRISDLNVDALRRGGRTAVNVLVLGGNPDADLVRQLERLASVSQGQLLRDGPAALTMVTDAVALVNRYEVSFASPRGEGGDDHHRVTVRCDQAGHALEAAYPYTDEMVAEPAWWTSPAVWFVLVVGLLLVFGMLWFLQPRQVALLVVQGGEQDGQWFEVFDLPMRIGAREDNDILFAGPTLSGVHCLLEREGRNVVLVDQGAQFGTFVNGERVTRRVLADEDVIQLGEDVTLAFEARG